MTYLPEPQNDDQRLADSWWLSLRDDQRETYSRVRNSKGGLERLDAHLARQREGTGCGFEIFLLILGGIVGAVLMTLFQGPILKFFGYIVPD